MAEGGRAGQSKVMRWNVSKTSTEGYGEARPWRVLKIWTKTWEGIDSKRKNDKTDELFWQLDGYDWTKVRPKKRAGIRRAQ